MSPLFAGAPFEPAKRRWLVPLIYAYLLSWIPGWGCIGYMIYVLYGGCAEGPSATQKLDWSMSRGAALQYGPQGLV